MSDTKHNGANEMTNTEILEAMKAEVEELGLPVKVSTRIRVLGDKEPSELFVTASAFGKAGLTPAKEARVALVDWIIDNRDAFADRKVVNLRGRGNKIFRYTFCDRYPEHVFFGMRIENR